MGFGGGSSGPPPKDVLFLIGVLFVSYSLMRLGVDALGMLALGPQVFTEGHLWRLVTYAFVGLPTGGLWFLVSLLMIFWFGRDTYRALGRRSFWQLLAWVVPVAAVAASLTQILSADVFGGSVLRLYPLMQGQNFLLTVFIAAFATLYGNATILFMFVLPIRARWFLWLEILFAFMGYLDSRDLPGFVGLVTAVGATYAILSAGGPRRLLREWRLRLERLFLEWKMGRLRKKRKLRIVKDDDVVQGPWVN